MRLGHRLCTSTIDSSILFASFVVFVALLLNPGSRMAASAASAARGAVKQSCVAGAAGGLVNCKTVWLKGYVNSGIPGPEHFDIRETTVDTSEDALEDGSIVVQAHALSVDPYLRGRIKSVNPLSKKRAGGGTDVPLESDTGETAMTGFVAGKVIASKNPDWEVNDLIGGAMDFSTVQVLAPKRLKQTIVWKLTGFVDESNVSLGVGALGMPGATAYGGLVDILRPNKGKNETLFVSSAAGAVGSLVGQIAKSVYGCTVIGSCGGKVKNKRIVERYGFDHAIDYTTLENRSGDEGKGDLDERLRSVAPDGIDMYYENVGGVHFESAMTALRPHGRIAVCGVISKYNEAEAAPNKIDIGSMIYTFQRIEGFVATPWLRRERGDFLRDMSNWIQEKKFIPDETFFEGIDQWPLAFQSLFLKGNDKKSGKVVVRIPVN